MYGFPSSASLNQRSLKWTNAINASSSRKASIAPTDHKSPDIISLFTVNHKSSDPFHETQEIIDLDVDDDDVVTVETPKSEVKPSVTEDHTASENLTEIKALVSDMKHLMSELVQCLAEVKSMKHCVTEKSSEKSSENPSEKPVEEPVENLEPVLDVPKVFVPYNDSFEYACNDNETRLENNKMVMSLCVPNCKTVPLTIYPFGTASDMPDFESDMFDMQFTDDNGVSGVVYGEFSRDQKIYKIVAGDWYHNGAQISMETLTFPIVIKCERDL